RSNGIDGPHSNQAGRLVVSRALHLHRQPQYLEKQNHHQDGDIAVAADDVFHGLKPRRSSQVPWSLARGVSRFGGAERRPANDQRPLYSIEIFRSSLKSLSILPVPSTT